MATSTEPVTTLHTFRFRGVHVCTGDVLCTTDGLPGSAYGRFWQAVGLLMPGPIDHCLVYVGPEGRCVEAGGNGVIAFEMDADWTAGPLARERALLDRLHGAVYPLEGFAGDAAKLRDVRLGIANYVLAEAARSAPYNYNFFDTATTRRFYCSQLVHQAYAANGVLLPRVTRGRLLGRVAFPREIWRGNPHQRAQG
ncbi:hypothetical protein [Arenimonas sp. MALMAid1274]|uniref:hypothetical protein n=1 Tax=Arenimonas sp. MALMAid1274 TaxID=3411630 RepID=UPI003B9EAA96